MADLDDDYDKMMAERDAEYARRVELEVEHLEQEYHVREEREFEEEYDSKYDDEVKYEEERDHSASIEREHKVLWLLMSGNILIMRGFTKYYGQMIIIAALFLLSIVVMFWSLHLDMEHSRLQRDVQLLRERSIRLHEIRVARSSHSHIVEELSRRGIEIKDPTRPATIIDKRGR